MSIDSYLDSVAPLLTIGQKQLEHEWLDYPAKFGLTEAEIPELIRMAVDPLSNELDSEGAEVWAPIHAIRALGQLQAEAAIDPLIGLLQEDDDYFRTDLPKVFSLLGPKAIEPLTKFVKDEVQDVWARAAALSALAEMSKQHPEHRSGCLDFFMGQLQNAADMDPILVSFLVDELVALKATEAAPLIEQAFATGEVDEWLTGSWPMVQIELGLKQESDFTPEELQPKAPPHIQAIRQMLSQYDRQVNKPKGFGTAKIPAKKNKAKKKKR